MSASPGTTTLGCTKKITSTLFFVKVPRYFCFGIKKNRFTLFLNKYARQLRIQEINRNFTIGSLNIWHISALLVFNFRGHVPKEYGIWLFYIDLSDYNDEFDIFSKSAKSMINKI